MIRTHNPEVSLGKKSIEVNFLVHLRDTIMGRRRMSRRQNLSRGSSRTAVNDDFSTDTESRSPVYGARNETLSLSSMKTVL